MAYGSRYRRRVYRKRRGYTGRTLSTRSIYSKTGRYSQANQIYALRKRVGKISKRLRPDIKTYLNPAQQTTFDNSAIANTSSGFWYLGGINQGTNDSQRIGDKIYVKSFTWYANFEYANNFTDSPPLEAIGGTVRIVVLQAKLGQTFDGAYTPGSIIDGYGNTGAAYDMNTISPLLAGVTKTWYVLRDLRFKLDEDNPIKQLKLKIKPKFRTIRFSGTSTTGETLGQNVPNHGIFVLVCASGLHWDAINSEQIVMAHKAKTAYTDL